MPRALVQFLLIATAVALTAGCFDSSSGSSSDDDGDGPDDEIAGSPTVAGDILFNEVMAYPERLRDTQGEWFEVRNPTDTRFNLRDCVFSVANTTNFSVDIDLEIGPGELRTFAISAAPGFTPDFNYDGSGLRPNNNGDTLTMTCNGVTIDTRTYALAAVGEGRSTALSSNGNGKWCFDFGNNYNGDTGTPGTENVFCA